jgi:hypothetical protein
MTMTFDLSLYWKVFCHLKLFLDLRGMGHQKSWQRFWFLLKSVEPKTQRWGQFFLNQTSARYD